MYLNSVSCESCDSKTGSESCDSKANPASESGRRPRCSAPCLYTACAALILMQVFLICAAFGLEEDSDSMTRSIFFGYQTLAACHATLCLVLYYRWRSIDTAASLIIFELQVFIMTGWSYWLLGAFHQLTILRDLPKTAQTVAVTLHRVNCAFLEFNFTYLLQQRLSLLERGFGTEMGVSTIRRIRGVALTLQLTIDLFRAYCQVLSPLVIQLAAALYHLVAGVGVLCTLVTSLRAFLRVSRCLKEVPTPEKSFARLEKEWSLQVFSRMVKSMLVSCTISSLSHLLCIPAVFLVHGAARALLVPGYHFADIAAELGGLIFIVGILKPQLPQIGPQARAMRSPGSSKVLENDDTWNRKVEELARRRMDLGSLLDFYCSLGPNGDVMPDFDPSRSTTAEVVRKAVIPLSRVGHGGWSYSDVLDAAGRDCKDQMPECMVTHTWQCLFVHLLAAICADALGLEEYQALAQQLIEDPQGLRESLEAKGLLQKSYWICCFCINQHASICGRGSPGCTCSEPKILNDQPAECEVNKFDTLMLWLQLHKPHFRQLVAADIDFGVFERAWCVAELVAAHDADIPQSIVLHSTQPFDLEEQDFSVYWRLANLSVANSLATRPEDKEMILAKISSVPDFDAELQLLIFGNQGLLKQKLIGFDYLVPAARAARRLCSFSSHEQSSNV
eukprot:CAMPEP_0181418878 /NCGR_PEP_ID=MMETSP1110-20121109/11787_1 /TAXON_ID=174948 /ORGANISM="Symbiodinium sp., Strain CCMP421" /LENGTH=674 /DNA_ID=CAMNT_0023541881 /DNA_START=50 /DNA_END=2074 /DNA_ORIENTATION=-